MAQEMVEVWDLYKRRRHEVFRYIKFVCEYERGSSSTGTQPIKTKSKESSESSRIRDLKKMLRATTYLVLYNFMEATAENAMQAVYRTLSKENLDFDNLEPKLKRKLLKNIKKHFPPDNEAFLEPPLSKKMFTLSLERFLCSNPEKKERLFTGNVDSKRIKDCLAEYGILGQNDNNLPHAAYAQEIKDNRNSLAHGQQSFVECGQDVSCDSLPEIAKNTALWLRAILQSVTVYLENKEYRMI